jgi:steroid 5-alpha reductase family enzyme
VESNRRNALLGTIAAVLVGALVILAGSDGSVLAGPVPVFAICGALAFAVNWVAFIPANAARTEKYYDLTGSVTYLTVVSAAVVLSGSLDLRAWLAAALVVVWTLRLGIFLFRRISREGKDGRFDRIKEDPIRFFMAWTLQGLWALLTAAAALAIITTDSPRPFGWAAAFGLAVWVLGFTIEVVADAQKSKFKRDPSTKGRFISSGLWAWSRHPNYFGEITLWTGMAIMAVPILSGWRWVVLISPVFVTLLLTKVSGIPMLEARADERWGEDPEYQRHKESTPVLIPRPPES